jgi:hypothetical protein
VIVPERTGVHHVFVSVPSLKVKPSDLPFRGILVEAPRAQVSQAAGPG